MRHLFGVTEARKLYFRLVSFLGVAQVAHLSLLLCFCLVNKILAGDFFVFLKYQTYNWQLGLISLLPYRVASLFPQN